MAIGRISPAPQHSSITAVASSLGGSNHSNSHKSTTTTTSSPVPSGTLTPHTSSGNSSTTTTCAVGEILSNTVPRYSFCSPTGEVFEIRNVWADNVEREMKFLRQLIETHPYVAMDTEFPGVVVRPVSETYSPDYHYKSLKCNVDLLNVIQLGLTFADEHGNLAKGCPCWQFNFQFNLNDDIYAQDSIDLLMNSGISFEHHAKRGIDPLLFGELLMVSGLVLDDRVKWVSYHSGYDYAYLLKILTAKELPADEKSFFEALRLYFPTIYDIKYMTSLCDGHYGGLQKLADDLGCSRFGVEHQAGSDSLLTMTAYFALGRAKFPGLHPGEIDDSRFKNELYGYGANHTVFKGRFAPTMQLETIGNNSNNNIIGNHGIDI